MPRLSFLHLPVAIGLAGCAQVLGLSDYKEAGEGGSSTNSGPGSGTQSTNNSGSTGEGGGTPKPCTKDSDCSNGKFCDGAEHCGDDNTCSPGTPPCPPPGDTVHCMTPCEEGTDAAVCGAVQGIDGDADTHGNPLCQQAPGDDCNDDEAAMFPGNPEICDALDNDCNGLIDDEVLPSGLSEAFVGSDSLANAHMAAADSIGLYGISYVSSNQVPEIDLAFIDHNGASPQSPVSLGDYDNEGHFDLRPRVAVRDEKFGVVWHDENVPNGGIYMSVVTTTGGVIVDRVHASDFYDEGYEPDIVATDSADFIVVWAEPVSPPDISILAQKVLADGTLSGNAVNIADNTRGSFPHIARNGNQYVVVWNDVEGAMPVVKARAFNDSFTLGSVFTLATTMPAAESAVTAKGNGFAIAWRDPGSILAVATYDVALTQQAIDESTTNVHGGLSIASNDLEVMVLESDSNVTPEPTTRLFRFNNALVPFGPPEAISEANFIENRTGLSTIVASPMGVAVTWGNVRDQIETDEEIWFRAMGPNVCD